MAENENERAPGDLERVRSFVNTLHIDPRQPPEEDLESPADLDAWLRSHDLMAAGEGRADAGDLERAKELREALRALLAVNHGEPIEAGPVKTLRDASERAGLGLHFGDDGSSALEPDAPGVDAALGRLLADVHLAMADGTWARLKVCLADDCRWAFYDHSRNHSRRWCTMRVCGNLAKVRSYRARRAPAGA